MGEFESLLLQYRNDPLIKKVEEVYNKWRNHNGHKKIVKRKKDIYLLDLNDKFIKFPNILFECLTEINFSNKECFKLFFTVYKNIQRYGTPYMTCKKSYLLKQVKTNRMSLHRSIKELEDKKILLVERNDFQFKFFLNMAPLTWNISERERTCIEKEVEREIKRLDEKWIEENVFSG